MTKHTINRRSDVVTRVEGDETLVLDTQSNTAHCLSGSLASVWNSTEASVAKVAADTGLTVDAVEAAAATLADLDLVEAPAGLSRRTLVTRGAMLGGAVAAAGAISMPLPASAAAASTGTITLNAGCNKDGTSNFTFNEGGGVLAGPNVSYHVLVVYSSYEVDSAGHITAEVARTIEFDISTNGDGKPASGPTQINATPTTAYQPPAPQPTHQVDDHVSGIAVGTSGPKGFINLTTGYDFGAWALPSTQSGQYNGPGPATALTGYENSGLVPNLSPTTNGTTSGNVYLQITPTSNSALPHWNGYFSNGPCLSPPRNP